MNFYLDASVVVPLFVLEPRSMIVTTWVEQASGDLMVSGLAAAEVGATISRLVRSEHITDSEQTGVMAAFDRWRMLVTENVENLPADIRAAGELVRRPFPKLLSPDAIHLATCRRVGATLVTHDERLMEIARREAITVLSLE